MEGEYKVVGYWDLGEEKVYEFGVHGKWSVVGFHWDRDLCGDECEIYCCFVLTCAGGGGNGRFVLGFDC